MVPNRVEFRCSALDAEQIPSEWLPHLAVAGRSNVGKSSLLNWLWGVRLARVAKAPGKTRTLNFYLVDDTAYAVDLPGYGYAAVGKTLRQQWGAQVGRYLAEEERLAGVMTLIDIRRGPTELDLELQQFLERHGRETLVVLTKDDKLKRGRRAAQRFAVQRQLGLPQPPLTVSVHSGEGRRELRETVSELLERWRENQTGRS